VMRGIRRRESYEVFPDFNQMERICEPQSQMPSAPLQITETNSDSASGYKKTGRHRKTLAMQSRVWLKALLSEYKRPDSPPIQLH